MVGIESSVAHSANSVVLLCILIPLDVVEAYHSKTSKQTLHGQHTSQPAKTLLCLPTQASNILHRTILSIYSMHHNHRHIPSICITGVTYIHMCDPYALVLVRWSPEISPWLGTFHCGLHTASLMLVNYGLILACHTALILCCSSVQQMNEDWAGHDGIDMVFLPR